MIGDDIYIKPHHMKPARIIVAHLLEEPPAEGAVRTLSVGGESGSGKSTLSLALQRVLKEKGYETFIFHMDDYFRLPPKDNHDQREQNIGAVGPGEVNLEVLQEHLDAVKKGCRRLSKPLVHYRENAVRQVIVELDDIAFAIAEGSYVTMLDRVDTRIFMERTYEETYEDRVARGRDRIIPFTEKVLAIEHEIIKNHAEKADIRVNNAYEVSFAGN